MGTVAAFAVWWLVGRVQSRWQRGVAWATLALFGVLLVGGMVYPTMNLRNVARDGEFIGLAGRTPREFSAAGAASTAWIRENVPSGSVVLEMVAPNGGSYNGEGYAGIAASTGRPTVLGWVGHQVQWRNGDVAARAELDPRKADVDTIYSTTDINVARDLLEKYDVRYVYIGGLERQNYNTESLAKFDQLGAPVFQQDEVTIYQLHTGQ
ncbi:MAG: hypothetical protein HC893_14620 [Chloroflexaceae bacterium]|nr:hypothetical protein [Chloroflexaceae bacterium]